MDGACGVGEGETVVAVPLPHAATNSMEVRTPNAALILTSTVRGRAVLWIYGGAPSRRSNSAVLTVRVGQLRPMR